VTLSHWAAGEDGDDDLFNPYAFALIIIALLVLALSWNVPRAKLWMAVGGASFFASSLWWDFGDQSVHHIFTMTGDMLVCLAVYNVAKEMWEAGIFLAFFLSVGVSLLRIVGSLPDGDMYASFLEACNYFALACIGFMGILDRVSRYEHTVFSRWYRGLRSTRDSLW